MPAETAITIEPGIALQEKAAREVVRRPATMSPVVRLYRKNFCCEACMHGKHNLCSGCRCKEINHSGRVWLGRDFYPST